MFARKSILKRVIASHSKCAEAIYPRCVRFKTSFTRSGSQKSTTYGTLSIATALITGAAFGIFYSSKLSASKQVFPLQSTTPLSALETPRYGSHEALAKCLDEIREVLGPEYVRTDDVELDHHTDNGFNPSKPLPHQRPECIVYPITTEEVSAVMKIINRYNIPVVPYSGGTSLEGHFYSTRPGIVLNTSRMNKVLRVDHDDLDAVVQAGVGWQQLNEYLSNEDGLENLMLGCDCGPGAHICGMVSTNASGIGATRYGSMASNVIAIKAVLSDGTIIKTKQRPRKSSAGYNLTGLLVGSEGTLAIVTEVTVKLQVRPAYETVAVVQFPSLEDCTKTVATLFKRGIQLNAVELLDENMMRCINYSNMITKEYENLPTLFFKIAGLNKTVVNEYVNEVSAVSKENHCKMFEFAKDEREAEELFSARKNALYLMLDYGYNEINENAKMWITDCAVPLSRLATTLNEINKLMDKSPLHYMILGHVGDGNFHCDIFYEPEQLELCKQLVYKITKIGLENEGTCSGEHGIGTGKRAFLEMELGTTSIDTMRKLKLALDPKRLLNPDKIFKIDPLDPSDD